MPIILAEDRGSETDLGRPCLKEKIKKKKRRRQRREGRGEGAGREGEKR